VWVRRCRRFRLRAGNCLLWFAAASSATDCDSGQLSTRADDDFFLTAHALGVASDMLVLSCALTEDTRHVVDRGRWAGAACSSTSGAAAWSTSRSWCGACGRASLAAPGRKCWRSSSPWTTSCCQATGSCSRRSPCAPTLAPKDRAVGPKKSEVAG